MANTTQWLASLDFQRSALSLSWHILDKVNRVNEEPGLAVENLHSSLQHLTYNVLVDLGSATTWATPNYRSLPAAAAGIAPGTLSKIPLPQCMELTAHTPAACFDHYDGSWDGECTVYLPPYQLLPVSELGRALNLEQVLWYLDNCSSSKSLGELLFLQLHKGLLAADAAAVLSVQKGVQQQQCQLATTAAATAAAEDVDSCYSTNSCEDGGGMGYRGSLTAIGADDDDDDDDDDRVGVAVALVPARLNKQQRHRQECPVSSQPAESAVSNVVSSSSSSNGSSKRSVLRRLGSALRCLCYRPLRA